MQVKYKHSNYHESQNSPHPPHFHDWDLWKNSMSYEEYDIRDFKYFDYENQHVIVVSMVNWSHKYLRMYSVLPESSGSCSPWDIVCTHSEVRNIQMI